jgi:hypothetical protein
MEINQYGVWRCNVKVMERRYVQDGTDMNYSGSVEVGVRLVVVAPVGMLGRALLDVHFNNAFQINAKLPSGASWEWVEEPEFEPVNRVIRYEDEYRSRM